MYLTYDRFVGSILESVGKDDGSILHYGSCSAFEHDFPALTAIAIFIGKYWFKCIDNFHAFGVQVLAVGRKVNLLSN